MLFFRALVTSMKFLRGFFLEESALYTVESAEGRNFPEFANFREGFYPWKCTFWGSLCKILTKKGENRSENAQKWIYLFIQSRKFIPTNFCQQSDRESFFFFMQPRKLIPAKIFEPAKLCTQGTFYWTQHVFPFGLLSAGAFIRRGFYPPGLLSAGAFIRRGFYPPGLLSAGAFIRRGFYPLGLLSVGAFIRWGFYPLGLLSVGAFIRRGFYPPGLLSAGAFIRWGFCPLGLLSVGAFVRWGFCPLGLLSVGAFVRAPRTRRIWNPNITFQERFKKCSYSTNLM